MSLGERISKASKALFQKDERKVKGTIDLKNKGWKWHHGYLYIDLPKEYTVDEPYWSYRACQSFPVVYMKSPNQLVVTIKKNIEGEA